MKTPQNKCSVCKGLKNVHEIHIKVPCKTHQLINKNNQ